MTQPARVGSDWVLTRARDYETPMHVFLRETQGLTRTGFSSHVLDLTTQRTQRLIVSAPEREGKLYPLHAGDQVEFFFEIDGVGYAFSSMVQERVRYALNPQRHLPALRLTYPDGVIKIQRRTYYRATAPPDSPRPVKLRLPAAEETDEDRMFATDYPHTGEMVDISGAGIAVFMTDPLPFEPEINDTLTVAFRLTDEDANDIVLDTRLRGLTEGAERSGTNLHLAWLNCKEDDDATGAFASRIFRYVADRQRAILQERHERIRRRR